MFGAAPSERRRQAATHCDSQAAAREQWPHPLVLGGSGWGLAAAGAAPFERRRRAGPSLLQPLQPLQCPPLALHLLQFHLGLDLAIQCHNKFGHQLLLRPVCNATCSIGAGRAAVSGATAERTRRRRQGAVPSHKQQQHQQWQEQQPP